MSRVTIEESTAYDSKVVFESFNKCSIRRSLLLKANKMGKKMKDKIERLFSFY